jgi:hypothetical protein
VVTFQALRHFTCRIEPAARKLNRSCSCRWWRSIGVNRYEDNLLTGGTPARRWPPIGGSPGHKFLGTLDPECCIHQDSRGPPVKQAVALQRTFVVLDLLRDKLNLTERAEAPLLKLMTNWEPLAVGIEEYGLMGAISSTSSTKEIISSTSAAPSPRKRGSGGCYPSLRNAGSFCRRLGTRPCTTKPPSTFGRRGNTWHCPLGSMTNTGLPRHTEDQAMQLRWPEAGARGFGNRSERSDTLA